MWVDGGRSVLVLIGVAFGLFLFYFLLTINISLTNIILSKHHFIKLNHIKTIHQTIKTFTRSLNKSLAQSIKLSSDHSLDGGFIKMSGGYRSNVLINCVILCKCLIKMLKCFENIAKNTPKWPKSACFCSKYGQFRPIFAYMGTSRGFLPSFCSFLDIKLQIGGKHSHFGRKLCQNQPKFPYIPPKSSFYAHFSHTKCKYGVNGVILDVILANMGIYVAFWT